MAGARIPGALGLAGRPAEPIDFGARNLQQSSVPGVTGSSLVAHITDPVAGGNRDLPMAAAPVASRTGTPSGSNWVARYPTSTRISDLAPAFANSVSSFVGALRDAGATVRIGATLRPPQRAYLMHWSWRVANEGYDPRRVPPQDAVDIIWDHTDARGEYDELASRHAARDMVNGYEIAFRPSLASRHTEGRAIDMTINWAGALSVRDAASKVVAITSTPRSGENSALQTVGASYGVVKLASDPPHWSDDGH